MFHWRYTSTGGVTKDIIRPVVSVSLEIYLCWWSHQGYHPLSGQCFTGDIPLLVESMRISSASSQCLTGDIPLLVGSPRISSATGGIIEDPPSRQCFNGDIPLLVESPRIIRPVVSVSLGIYLCWWSHRGYHPPSSQCFNGDIPLLVE